MDLDALFRMPMTRRPGDGGLRPFACGTGAGFHAVQPCFPGEEGGAGSTIDLAPGR